MSLLFSIEKIDDVILSARVALAEIGIKLIEESDCTVSSSKRNDYVRWWQILKAIEAGKNEYEDNKFQRLVAILYYGLRLQSTNFTINPLFQEILDSLGIHITFGKGIHDMYINGSGQLIVVYTDGTSKNLGEVKGSQGANGVGVSTAIVNEDGELVITLTNSNIINVGVVTGEQGEQGETGQQGEKGDKGEKGDQGDVGPQGPPTPFTSIIENQVGEHPAFASQEELNLYLLGLLTSIPPVWNDNEIWDDNGIENW